MSNYNALDFRKSLVNDLKIISSADSISDKQVLILTRKSDLEATRVSIRLLAKGIDSVRINVEDMSYQLRVRFHVGNIRDPRIEFSMGDRDLDSYKFPVVWLRDFDTTRIGFDFCTNTNRLVQRFCYEQWNDSYNILIDGLASEWINGPEAIFKTSNRFRQLMIAEDIGFKIPSTLITNDPTTATEFYNHHNGQIVLKTVHHHGIEIEGKVYSIYTRSLTKDSLSRLVDLIYAPCILQERLKKKSELRVTIVGEKVFATELQTETIPVCCDDLHRGTLSEIPKRAVKLDNATEASCLKMMNIFGLKYGAFDFILDGRNQLYFLEINPSGDWYWIENDTKQPITETMVNLIETRVRGTL